LGASTERIIEQVDKCPSGALSYFFNTEGPKEPTNDAEVIVEIDAKGPLMIYGKINIIDQDGTITERNKSTAFCRCGASANKPYCDGSHSRIDFKG
jgi:CDGSH-type Zn-finger protein